jgi:HSP20 family protein
MNTCCIPNDTRAEATTEAPVLKPRYFVDGTQDAYEVRVELPGVAKDGVSVDLDQNILTVRAKRKASVPENWKTLHRELNDLDYLLRLKLNNQVDESKLSATLENGVLSLRLPVREAAKPRAIQVG